MGLPPFNWINRLARVLRTHGFYGAIALVVPGGSLFVLSLWAIRHRSSLAAWVRHAFARRAEAVKGESEGLIKRSNEEINDVHSYLCGLGWSPRTLRLGSTLAHTGAAGATQFLARGGRDTQRGQRQSLRREG